MRRSPGSVVPAVGPTDRTESSEVDPGQSLTRRELLSVAAGGSLATMGFGYGGGNAALARALARPGGDARNRVVVVGAGLAGLTAAVDLQRAGWEVVVKEARNRVGGRVLTIRSPFSPGLHAEAGGESLDDDYHAMLALIARYGLRTERRPADKLTRSMVYQDHRRFSFAEYSAGSGRQAVADYLGFEDRLVRLVKGIDVAHPERFGRAKQLDRRTLAEFVAEQHYGRANELLITDEFRGSYNADLDRLSLLSVAWQEQVGYNLPLSGVETMRISGGNDQLPRAQAAELGRAVHLSSPVTRIEYDRGGVRVHAGGSPIEAAWLVLATPPPPLRRVRFSPALPASVAAMIHGLDLGPAVKVITQFKTRFWEREGLSGFMITDLPFGVGWAPTDSYRSTQGLLTQFITGSAAEHAARLDDRDRLAWAGAQLDAVFPEGKAARAGPRISQVWTKERYTGGGYAFFRPGQVVKFWPVLRSGFARVRFAGEHTETLNGDMESAIRSGHRVAAEIGARSRHRVLR